MVGGKQVHIGFYLRNSNHSSESGIASRLLKMGCTNVLISFSVELLAGLYLNAGKIPINLPLRNLRISMIISELKIHEEDVEFILTAF
jgi:hypothetical protein